MTPSLRRQLLLSAAAAITAVFAVLAIVLYFSVRMWLIAELDRGLLAEAESLRAATEFHKGVIRLDFDGPPPQHFAPGSHTGYYELWEGDRPVARSPSLGSRELVFLKAAPDRPRFQFDRLPDNGNGRQVAVTFEVSPDREDGEIVSPGHGRHGPLTLVVASEASRTFAALTNLRWLLAGACGAALLACLALLSTAIRRGLYPVRRMADRIERVGRTNLADRLDVAGVPPELLPVVERLNEMLARLEQTFERERAFTADVAHELRTPLAGLETTLEVAASRERRPEEYRQVVGRCLGVTRQMHSMVDSLLMLARADAGTLAVSRAPFDVEVVIEECWKPFAARADVRRLRVKQAVEVSGPIYADRDKFRQVLNNLFDNAVSYADEGGTIDILVNDEPHFTLAVANSGSTLSQEQADRATERFWRGDAARSQTGLHSGLGLAITRELVALLGGNITITSREGGDFSVRVTLPLAAPSAESLRDSNGASSAARARSFAS